VVALTDAPRNPAERRCLAMGFDALLAGLDAARVRVPRQRGVQGHPRAGEGGGARLLGGIWKLHLGGVPGAAQRHLRAVGDAAALPSGRGSRLPAAVGEAFELRAGGGPREGLAPGGRGRRVRGARCERPRPSSGGRDDRRRLGGIGMGVSSPGGKFDACGAEGQGERMETATATSHGARRAGEDEGDREAVAQLAEARSRLLRELDKRIVGQREVIEHLLIALFSRGHCLFVGVPGLAKTLLISTLAEVLDLSFSRIQFTPDLMPSDITGTDVLEEDRSTGRRAFRFVKGPLFANIVLADEINRTPPKTQAALLQSMQEYKVTAGGTTYPLDLPFLVFATENPIEQEGTYPLPEAQLDRFMFFVDVTYPSAEDEVEIVKATTGAKREPLAKVLSPERIRALQDLVLRVPATDSVVRYAVDLVRRSRPKQEGAPPFVAENLAFGAGPRASQYLVLGAKARAILDGRFAATVEDVRALARPVLRHRLITNFHAEAEGVSSLAVIEKLLAG
jgi:MoxR-like ATPase